ncbi:sodium:proton antiporter [Actinoplanes sp. KI2]|uniref:MnhB domain-containing protein n=1 Tax=Actinoplanes sp. KI2 TaxID=2983315 RepID=UPI0021D5D469|nr:MnhB domain-containing protein [Actinoplanes sp. KI2]MCU7726268.1 sodium:proton antiporter [Actinoplanes sp. KI2]
MSRRTRTLVFAAGAAVLILLFALTVAGLPPFGGGEHPYRDLAVAASLQQSTANVVSSLTFDLRGLDTLGEEMILLGSVVGTVALLRPRKDETARNRTRTETNQAVALIAYVFLPLTLLLGFDLLVHGHLTPGGGFQGGVVLATGLHLLYLSGGYDALRRLRPLSWYEWVEGLTTAAFAAAGLIGVRNFLPHGTVQQLFSAGTVPILNILVGFAVGAGAVVLLAQFLTQAVALDEGSG